MPEHRPPLGLHIELTDASGIHRRLGADGSAQDRPQGLGHRTRRGDGFADGGFTLPRDIFLEYPDIGLYDSVAFIGYDGSVAYEGRISGQPRSLDAGHSITVQLVGWMAHARDQKFAQVYIDRETSAWGEMPLNRKVSELSGGRDIGSLSWSGENGGLVCALPNQALGSQVLAEAWYTAPSGLKVAKLLYVGTESLPGGYEAAALFTDDNDALSSAASTSLTLDNTVRTATPTTPERYAVVHVHANGTAATPTAGMHRTMSKLGVVGDHGLDLHSIDGDLFGVYVSDVMRHIAANWCPKLNTDGVVDTTYPIAHVAFKDRIHPIDAFAELNRVHIWDIGVWENRTLHFRPFDLSDYDWQVRAGQNGVTVSLQGDSTDDLANGIVVEFTNLLTGQREVLTPDDYDELRDDSVENPANRHGLQVWTETTIAAPYHPDDALQYGRMALAEFNQPKAPGEINVPGHIQDRAGHWHPVWKVRQGDTIAIVNHPNDRPRMIVETDYTHGSPPRLKIAVDATFNRIEAINDRLALARHAAGLA